MSVFDLHAVTVWPERAWAITNLDKRVINRVWAPKPEFANSRIAIHAGANIGGSMSKKTDRYGIDALVEASNGAGWSSKFEYNPVSTFAVFWKKRHTVNFNNQDVVKKAIVAIATLVGWRKADNEKLPPWGASSQYHWYIKDVLVLPSAIECKGQQRLWKVSKEHVTNIKRQLGFS